MKAGNQQTANTCIDHNAEITSDNVTLNVTGAILVGGAARRLDGLFKPSLLIDGRSIIARQRDAFAACGIDRVLLVGRGSRRLGFGLAIADAMDGGALAGLYTALIAATAPIVMVLAGDMPFVTPALIARLVRLNDQDEVHAPRLDGRWHPLCAAYRRTVASRLKARLDRRTLRISDALSDLRVAELTAQALADCGPTNMLLTNVNTADDYSAATRAVHPHA